MSHIIQMQSNTRSAADQSKLCSFDHEVIEAPTNALIHQEGRFLWVKKGRGIITVQSRPYMLEPGTLLCVLPWQITQVTQVEEPLQYYLVVYHLDSLNKLIKSFTEPDGAPAMWIVDITASPAVHCDRRQAAAIEAAFSGRCGRSRYGVCLRCAGVKASRKHCGYEPANQYRSAV